MASSLRFGFRLKFLTKRKLFIFTLLILILGFYFLLLRQLPSNKSEWPWNSRPDSVGRGGDDYDPFLLITSQLPTKSSRNPEIETKLMPYVGNGHLASTIFDNSIFVNGLYNGAKTSSHRARLPNPQNFSFVSPDPQGFQHSKYTLDMRKGVFTEQLEDNLVIIKRRIYAHQFFNRLLITQVDIKRKTKAKILIKLDNARNYLSDDFDFQPLEMKNGFNILRGKTKEVEYNEFQKDVRPVVMYFTEPHDFTIDEDSENDSFSWLLITSIDVEEPNAKTEFDAAMSFISKRLFNKFLEMHTSRFEQLWTMGRIETDNAEIQTLINSCFYYILSSLPAIDHFGHLGQFYGLSPGSLSRGSSTNDYQGHSFWDTETWMFPPILMFHPNLAKTILSYRTSAPDAYSYNAKISNTSGWKYSWESAFTGLDVTPDHDVMLYEIHNNGDIAFAARQYYSATRDNKWLQSEGGSALILKQAEFWSSRITYNKTKSQFEILNVMPPDEDAEPCINNSIYTNVIASLAIHYANYVTCLTNSRPLDADKITKARCLHVPFDSQRQIHLEHENYADKVIKQADVVLLGYPIMWNMSEQVRRNDLIFYGDRTRATGPAMTWGIHAIGFLDLGELDKATQFFSETYAPYVRKPFNIWTEERGGLGAVNFITGMGGFLQTVVFGYGGLRLHAEELRLGGNLSPLVPTSTYLHLHRIKYLGASLSFNITISSIVLAVDRIGDEHKLEIVTPKKTIDLIEGGDQIVLPKTGFVYVIRAKKATNCALPLDTIDLKSC